ncbi:hypothetical protein Taro_048542 [Colocasia esculenta]|uniref:NAC domain-containing protein n=1 Tax=Colocasia esculenta TaxID=4460 RepID=A0A843X8E5_COLES|nr:hypothetical protein [Colocasia esculenta]
MERSWLEMDLPGFRFHPTEEELLEFYLKGAVHGKKLQPEIIRTLNLYRHDPWELPGMARMGEREWYFFVPRDRRSNNTGRPNRTTERGFWKATGSDRRIRSVSESNRVIGVKKTLVFYQGRAPRGTRTDWIMNEYRLPEEEEKYTNTTCASPCEPKEDIVLCRIYRKATSMKVLEQLAAMDTDVAENSTSSSSSSSFDKQISPKNPPTLPLPVAKDVKMPEMKVELEIEKASSPPTFNKQISLQKPPTLPVLVDMNMKMPEMKVELETEKEADITSVPVGLDTAAERVLPELELLKVPPRFGFDWPHDPLLTQLRSPWLDNWYPYYANTLSL